jgi:hypothetical protein
MKRLQFALIGIICVSQAYAQTSSDVFRYSQQFNLGTARSQGIGGAFGAVGADYSSTYLNPAGLGLYRRNDFHLSAAVTTNRADSRFLGTTETDNRTNFNIPSFGLVLTKVNTGLTGDAKKGIVSYNFAFGHNRSDNYQQNIFMQGRNTQNSISDFYIEQSNGIPFNNIDAVGREAEFSSLAWRAYLTDTADNNTTYYSPWLFGDSNYSLLQSQKITRRGAKNEYNFNTAVNIGDFIYLGAGLVFVNIRNEYTQEFTESDPNKTVVNSLGHTYNSSGLTITNNTTGTGVLGRFGFIIRPVDYFRFGLSAQTRMRVSMSDDYSYRVTSDIQNFGRYDIQSPALTSDYEIITPARYMASAMILIPRFGFISGDFEMVDYGKGRLTSESTFAEANQLVRRTYGEAYVLRLGTEIKLDDSHRLRLGYSAQSNPYKTTPGGVSADDLTIQSFSGGFGYTIGSEYLDFAAVYTRYNQFESPYTLANGNQPLGNVKNINFNFVVTYGHRF